MTDLDFWRKYCRAEYLLRTKNTAAAAAEAAEDEELAVFLKNDDILAKEAKLKVWLYQLLQLYFHILLPCIVAISF
jgi:transcription initiation factor TFIIH subunit 1